jgi:hypothetical protein
MRPSLPRLLLRPLALTAALLPTACSSGGDEERPTTTMPIESAVHFVGFTGRPEFGPFPVTTGDVLTYDHRLFLRDDGTYRRTDAGGQELDVDQYELEPDGEWSLVVPTSSNAVFYRGWLGLNEDIVGNARVITARDGFQTDRVGSAVGLYFATEIVQGAAPAPVELAGDWHVFSMHTLFAEPQSVPDEDRVGLAFAGALDLAEDGSFLGQGVESEEGPITLRGEPADFRADSDGRFEVELRYDVASKPDYERSFRAGGSGRVIFGVDMNLGGEDPAAGMLSMMKFRTEPFDAADLAGTYELGMWTLFLLPEASGADAAIGTLEIGETGSFRIVATNNLGQEFSYSGTTRAESSGTLTFTVTNPYTETWYGAFDDAYGTVVLCDNFKEVRPTRQVELNLGVAVRPRVPANQ